MSNIPTDQSIDAAWLTRRLRGAGHPTVNVESFTRQQIGTGQIGKCVRFDLQVTGDDTAPRSVVGKFPSDDPLSRESGIQLKAYIKEASFYRTLQSRVFINTPRCYYAEIEGDGPEFALLLEDLSPAQQGDQLSGCSEAVARIAIQQLVGLQVPGWCDHSLLGYTWLESPELLGGGAMRQLYRDKLPDFISRYAQQLSADELAIIEAVGCSDRVIGRPLGDRFSLVHGDYRLDNLLITQSSDEPTTVCVDWQSIILGDPLTDVGYFIGAGLLPELRRSVEEDIVRDYHCALLNNGIENFGWAQCWEDYRRATFAGFPVTVIASMLVQQTERGDEMFVAMAKRHSRHAIDLHAGEFL